MKFKDYYAGQDGLRNQKKTINFNGRNINMEPVKIAKQMIDFQKATFDNTFSAMILLQEQAEGMANTLLDQATWMPEEGKKAINNWVGAYKKGREDFKKGVDESFKRVEDFFASFEKGKRTKK